MNERQLAWVQGNRQPAQPAERVGKLAGRVLEGVSNSTAGHLTQLQRVIGAGTDPEFRRHCTLGSLRNNVLIILVDQESLVSVMRLEWFLPLRELIAERCRRFHLCDIRFQVGRSELALVDSRTGSGGQEHEGQY